MKSMPFMASTTKAVDPGNQGRMAAERNYAQSRNSTHLNPKSFTETLGQATREIGREPQSKEPKKTESFLRNQTGQHIVDKTARETRQTAIDATKENEQPTETESLREAPGKNNACASNVCANNDQPNKAVVQSSSGSGAKDKVNDEVAIGSDLSTDLAAVCSGQLEVDLVQQLNLLLQIIGLVNSGNGQSGIDGETQHLPGRNLSDGEITQILSFLTEGQTVVGQTMAKALQQLVEHLRAGKDLPPELINLKLLLENQINNKELLPSDFLGKLMDTVNKIIANSSRSNASSANSQKDTPLNSSPVIEAVLSPNGQGDEKSTIKQAGKVIGEGSPGGKEVIANGNSRNLEKNPNNVDLENVSENKEEKVRTGNLDNGSTKNDKKITVGEFVKALTGGLGENKDASLSQPKSTYTSPQVKTQDSMVQIQQTPIQAAVGKAEQMTMVPRMTQVIFGQIAQKAKLIVTPGLTEIQIQLKPEFLGKLNLRISSENGIVTAKFNAESQMVKGVIEANLSNLRDALTEQGVKVDRLVVDVGTQKEQSGFNGREHSFFNQGSTKSHGMIQHGEEYDKLISTELQWEMNRKLYGNTVEFTA